MRTSYIGGNIKRISSEAFKNCTSIQTMVIDPTGGAVDIGGFEGCTNLESVTINNTVSTIGEAAFKGCSKLRSFTVEGSSIFDKREQLEYLLLVDYQYYTL